MSMNSISQNLKAFWKLIMPKSNFSFNIRNIRRLNATTTFGNVDLTPNERALICQQAVHEERTANKYYNYSRMGDNDTLAQNILLATRSRQIKKNAEKEKSEQIATGFKVCLW